MLDGPSTAQKALTQAVAAVVEYRLPQHHQVVRIVESDGDGVRHLASILLGKNTAGHVSRGWQIKTEGGGNPGNLVDHVLSDIASGEFPEQAPVDELIGVKRPCRMSVKEGVPAHIAGDAVGGDWTPPFALPLWR